jgi:HEAT repeats/PBS lyase HEAT-like repeat
MNMQRTIYWFTFPVAILLASPIQAGEVDSSAPVVKLHESLSNLCLVVERAYQAVGLTRDDVNAVLAVQAPPQKIWGPYQDAWPAIHKARTAAADEMAALGAGAIPLLLKAKDESLGGAAHGDIFVDTLEKIGKPGVPALLDALTDPDTPVRLRALTALARIRDARAVEAVLRLLEDPDQQIARTAVWALELLKDERAVEPLLSVWNKGLFRQEVAAALGFQRDKRAVRPLVAALEGCLAEAKRTGNWNNQEGLMVACAQALGQLRDPEAIAVLKIALEAGPQPTKKLPAGQSYRVAEAAGGALRNFGFRIEGDMDKGGYHIVADPEAPQER